jgi:hypothetical protein
MLPLDMPKWLSDTCMLTSARVTCTPFREWLYDIGSMSWGDNTELYVIHGLASCVRGFGFAYRHRATSVV